jgi:Purine catabolism regulatory protein-like family/PucR C-terminal helix-turn-helix domain/GGDEF-like domain
MLTVADILGIDELELTLRAGAPGRLRPLRWVHTSELPDPTPWLRGGELLLTTGLPLQADPAGFIRLLSERGLSGMGLGLGFGFDDVPSGAIEEADRREFPVFTIPYHVPFIALTEAVFTRLSDERVAEAERRLAGDLVETIIAGEAQSREIRRRARAFGLRGSSPLTFVVLRADNGATGGLTRMVEAARRFGPASVRDGAVAVLVEAADDRAAERTAAELLAAAEAVAAGVGRVRSDPGELPRCYDEALYAVDIRPANGTPAVATFRDLGSIQLLLSLQDDRGVELFCDSLLGTLLAHDKSQGSALVESLRGYIEANGRWAEAADALRIHRHTLRYRVRKIEELTGRDLSNARDRLELWLALRASELHTPHHLEAVQ